MSKHSADLGFVHHFVPASDPQRSPLLLLHGTGGDEADLLPLGARLAPGAALLSPRGKVLENGMPRFFRRLAEGVFDLEDLKLRTAELADFVARAREAYGVEKPIAVGFSNGANIAASLLLTRPHILAGAVLMRAMTPFEPRTLPNLGGVPVLILSGATDPLVPPADRDRLAKLFSMAGADVTHEVVPAGHGLSPQDVAAAKHWLAAR
jgi:phospholipase/carboxylesterase